MRKILVMTALTVAMSAVASSQTNDRQTKANQSAELIVLSQEFVKTAIVAVAVEMGGSNNDSICSNVHGSKKAMGSCWHKGSKDSH